VLLVDNENQKYALLTYPDGYLAILFLCVHPLVTSFDPPLTFQPLIKSMAGHQRTSGKNCHDFSFKGNSIFFIGASEVATSEEEHYAVYNYFNKQLHKPVVAYGDSFVDDTTQFLLFSRFKDALTQTVKLFCFWLLTAFIRKVCHQQSLPIISRVLFSIR
jgi:D-alanine transfer protein